MVLTRLTAVATFGVVVLAGCGDSTQAPTAASYCSYFYEQGSKVRQRYIDADKNMDSNPVAGIITALGAPGDLAAFFSGLAKHAPDEIQADVEALAKAFDSQAQNQTNSATHPLSGLVGGMVGAANAAGPYQRVDAYTKANCAQPPSGS